MAKGKKKSTQTSLFDGKAPPKGTLTTKEIGSEEGAGTLVASKQYGGISIDELTVKIKAICEKYEGTYEPSEWNGTAHICVYHSNIGAIIGIVSEVDEMVKQHEFRAKTVIHHHASDKFGFMYMVRLTVPGPLKVSHFGCIS
jgi:hypothetical protein